MFLDGNPYHFVRPRLIDASGGVWPLPDRAVLLGQRDCSAGVFLSSEFGSKPARAKGAVSTAREHYPQMLDDLGWKVDALIEATLEHAAGLPLARTSADNYLQSLEQLQRVVSFSRFMRDVIEDRGLLNTLKLIVKRIRARRFKI